MRPSFVFALLAIGLILFSTQTAAQSSLFSGGSSTSTSASSATTSDDSDNSDLSTITGTTLSPGARSTIHELHLLEIYDTRGVRSDFEDQYYSTSSDASYMTIAPAAILVGGVLMAI